MENRAVIPNVNVVLVLSLEPDLQIMVIDQELNHQNKASLSNSVTSLRWLMCPPTGKMNFHPETGFDLTTGCTAFNSMPTFSGAPLGLS